MKNIAATAASLDIRMRRRAVHTASELSSLVTLAVSGVIVAVLWFARGVFVPLAVAILLSFVLGPLVMRLRRWHLGRVPSVFAVVLSAFLAIFGIGALIATQLTQLAEELPRYEFNIVQKIQSVKGLGTGSGVIGRTTALLSDLGGELTKPVDPNGATATVARQPIPREPVTVEIHQPIASPMTIILNVIGPLLQPFETTGIVIVFVIFFLLQREQLRDRFIRLIGSDDLRHTTEALDDAFNRLGRYLLTQTVINTGFGLVIGSGLWFIGIPNPILWGTLGMLLRFVPYVGALIAAISPLALAVAVDPGWSTLLWTGGLYLGVEAVTSQLIEPFFYGRSTGLSAVAIVVATTFWTWLWGPAGLLLSMPLTLCLIVLGRHVAALEFLDVLLGDEPALTDEEKFYQRMLAGDSDEAAYQAEAFLKTGALADYYDAVVINGLALAQLDVNRGELDHARRVRIREAVEAVVDDLSDHASPPASVEDDAITPATEQVAPCVLCIAGRGSLDEAVSIMLAQLLSKANVGARVVANTEVSAPNLARLDSTGVRLVCLSYLEPGDFANARYLVRRLRRKLPNAKIIAGFWTLTAADALSREAIKETSADEVVTSLGEAAERLTALALQPVRRAEPGYSLRGTV